MVAALATAQSAWAAPAPLRVTSIDPAVAERGELVTIHGGGFGARNLEVTVGGDPVELVSATGSRASFRVPALGAVGDVTVVARNPGGHLGRIGLTVRFDGRTAAVADEAAAVATPVGEGGGTIAVEGMELAIPPGAVPAGTTITATPLRSLQGSPFAAAPIGLKLEPSGLVLLQPATLTLPNPQGEGTVVAFGFNGSGQGLHLVPHVSSADSISVQVWHFSGAGTVSVSSAELEAALGYEPTPAHELAEQRIAAALAQALPPADQEALIFTALLDWYQRSVRTGLQVSRSGPLGFFELAFGEWQAWLGNVALYSSSSWTQQTNEAFALALTAAGEQAQTLLPRCTASGSPIPALRNVIRLAAVVNLVDLPLEQQLDADGRPLPTGPALPTACLRVEMVALTHASALARGRDNVFEADAAVGFFDGSSSTTMGLRFRLEDVTDGAPVPLASATTTTGHAEAIVRPTTLGQRVYDLTVELEGASADPVLRAFSARRNVGVPVRERLELHGRRAADPSFADTIGSVAPGGTVSLRVRLAGDDIGGVPITFTHDGTGTVPAAATTDPNGIAIVNYVAPASAAIELVTATVTDDGFATGDALVITTREPVVVTVTPSFGFAPAGGTVQFSAAVSGTTNAAVTWSAAGGSIDANGRFTAGSSAGVFAVTATSVADPTVAGTAFVQVTAENVAGLYSGERCFRFEGEIVSCGFAWLAYGCSRQSFVGNGTVCGWSTTDLFQPIGFPRINVPTLIRFCEVETDGTAAGGAFTGRITFCHPPPLSLVPASYYSGVSISGSIGGNRLTMTVDSGDPRVVESYDLEKVG